MSVLVVDDEPAHAEAIRRAFRAAEPATSVRVSGTLREYRDAVAARAPHIALVDLNLPDGRAIDILTSPPESGAFPVVIMTSHGDERIAVEAMKAGALDYVVKSPEAFAGMPHTTARSLREWRLLQERKISGEALRKSEERFRELFGKMGAGVAVYEPVAEGDDFVLRDLNAAGEAITGLRRAEALGRRVTRLLPEVVEAGLLAILREVGRTGLPTRCSATVLKGERIAQSTESFVYRLSSGEVVAIFEDVTEQRGTEDQLRMSQKMEAIGRLAGGVAHDFNNLLSVIISYTGLAIEGLAEGDRLRADLLEVNQAGERAAALTRQLLAFSRKQVLQPEILDLNAVVGAMGGMLQRLIGEDIELRTILGKELGRVKADPGQIEQVLMNLVVNSRDAMPEGGMLTIETANADLDEEYASHHPTVRPGPQVLVSVTDTGSGMDEQTRARLFEPFFTTKAPGKGTGLGLSMVYGIVKQSGGNVWVYSEPGKGTTFKVYLPREPDDAVAIPRPARAVTKAAGSETILVVEDDEAVRKLAARILGAVGYTVLVAESGARALQVLEQHRSPLHLLLTDVVMPQMGGRELAQRVHLDRPDLKVLYMSGYTDDAIVHHGVLDPGTHFVGKPLNAVDLTRRVREVLDA